MRIYLALAAILITLTLVSVGYLVVTLPDASTTALAHPRKDVVIHIPAHTWSYVPDHIIVTSGDELHLTLVSEDDIAHGFAIDEYYVNMPLPPHSTRTIPTFIASGSGDKLFYTSVSDGEGQVTTGKHKGETRGHFDMSGTLSVLTPESMAQKP